MTSSLPRASLSTLMRTAVPLLEDMFLTPLGCSTVKISVEVLEVVRHMKTII